MSPGNLLFKHRQLDFRNALGRISALIIRAQVDFPVRTGDLITVVSNPFHQGPIGNIEVFITSGMDNTVALI